MRSRLLALLALAGACGYTFRPPPPPPVDPREKQRAEAAACSKGTWPLWLDDAALNAALDLDRREALASAHNDSFRGATYTAQPPPMGRADSRASAILEERTGFQRRCEASKQRALP